MFLERKKKSARGTPRENHRFRIIIDNNTESVVLKNMKNMKSVTICNKCKKSEKSEKYEKCDNFKHNTD